MGEILFLSHRIPYPPDKGDKIRSYHLLRALAARHTVHLGAFVDDAKDWAHAEAVQRLCGGETCLLPLSPRAARLRSARGLFTGDPLSLAYYCDHSLRRWVADLSARRPLTGLFAFSSSMGQYAHDVQLSDGAPRVLDFCDVDSDKWRQYSTSHRGPMRLVYAREARALAATEARFVQQFDVSIVISDAEASILGAVARGHLDRIHVVANGVDAQFFDPAASFANPFDADARPIVFTGAMDYYANVDGVQWFVHEVLPTVRKREPAAVFAVVGSNPTGDVQALADQPGVIVTGRVPDVRPYLAHAHVAVAPLRLARGVQNKVLEALAMARPVVATPNALQGIPQADDAGVCIVGEAGTMASAIVDHLAAAQAAVRGRQFVLERYDWERRLEQVCALFGGPMARLSERATVSVAVV